MTPREPSEAEIDAVARKIDPLAFQSAASVKARGYEMHTDEEYDRVLAHRKNHARSFAKRIIKALDMHRAAYAVEAIEGRDG